ncbi:hypothetical protein FLJC2902T_21940 [Flavobacterium limnosediminis JC2902]|uniref:Uncharacterized protein n=2 Tax=Flavobacterium TaxID=237 RepID=V6SS31_9FLAO|nr:hypothetical protein FLJC2902T_21940 [Flavobacterium limnosediminis JC2902]
MVLFLFYLNRKIITYSKSVNYFDFIAKQWFKYGSMLILIIFCLVQIGIYNLSNTLIILFGIFIIDYFGIKGLPNFINVTSQKIKKNIFELIQNIELKKPLSFFILPRSNPKERNNRLWYLFLLSTVGLVTFFSRSIFYPFDMFSLSGSWISDLESVIDFDSQRWFTNEIAPVGEHALINFYGKFVSVTPEVALQSSGILEAVLISVLLFWVVNKISNSKIIAPLLASLFYAVSYTILPVNLSYILQHQSLYLAIALALPAMVIYLKPGFMHTSNRNCFINYIMAFTAIGLIDIFTLIVLVFPFLIIGLITSSLKYKISNLIAIAAYIISIAILWGIYGIACFHFSDDFLLFLHSGLMSVSSYTYFSHLIVSYDKLMVFYLYLSYFCILICLLLIFIKKEKWNAALCFLLYFNFLVMLSKVYNDWIDTDLIKLSLGVFIPILLGITTSIIIRFVYVFYSKIEVIKPVFAVILIAGVLYSAVHYQGKEYKKLHRTDNIPKELINVYEKITASYFPLSYAVVNDYTTQAISLNKHFFIHYTDFNESYLKRDSIYFKNRKSKIFLKNNPEYVLPESILVFVYKKGDDKTNRIIVNVEITPVILSKLKILKKRGREINVYYESDLIKVFEIVNTPKQSKTDDLIF